MGNCASGPKTKEGPAPEPAPAKQETVVKSTEEFEERDVEIKTGGAKPVVTDDSAHSFGYLLDLEGNQEEVKAEVKEDKEEQFETKPVVEELKKEEPKETLEDAAPAEPAKEEVEKKE